MKVQCYAIFDTCAGIYQKPFFSTTDDLVKREFQDAVNAPDCPINKHPEHYSVWRLGNFDDNTGLLNNEDNECLWQGIEALSQKQKTNGQVEMDYEPVHLHGLLPVRQEDE